MRRPLVPAAIAAAALASIGVAAAPPADARPSTASVVQPPGSILYVKSHDVYLTDSQRSATIRITHTGGRATRDHTGGVGFIAPSQSDNGKVLVVARNQNLAGADGAKQGWIWVLRRDGTIIRKFRPYQFALIGGLTGCVGGKYRQFPLGILNMKISPDGKRIAFDEKVDVVGSGSCQAVQSYGTFVVNIDGTHGRQVKRANGDGSFLEFGNWAGSDRILLDDVQFGSVRDFYANVPTDVAKPWFAASDNLDAAYGQPNLRAGKLATTGSSEYSRNDIGATLGVVRFWNATAPPASPQPVCEYRATAGGPTDGEFGSELPQASDPGLAPDGTAAVWVEIKNGRIDHADEGIYETRLPAGTLSGSNPCPYAKHELISEGSYPSWSPAPLHLQVTGGSQVSVRAHQVLSPRHALAPHGVAHVRVIGGPVPLGAARMSLRVTAIRPARAGGVTVWPDGRRRPRRVTFTFRAHRTRTRTVAVGIGADGKVAFANVSPARLHLRVVVTGYVRGTA